MFASPASPDGGFQRGNFVIDIPKGNAKAREKQCASIWVPDSDSIRIDELFKAYQSESSASSKETKDVSIPISICKSLLLCGACLNYQLDPEKTGYDVRFFRVDSFEAENSNGEDASEENEEITALKEANCLGKQAIGNALDDAEDGCLVVFAEKANTHASACTGWNELCA